jgi:Sugar transferases involved in lipopolysaccharide synthesis
LRHLVKPGVTGWAQVHQGYTFGEDEFAEKVKFDLYYIKYFSFSLDVLIAFRTLSIILFRIGAR